MVDQADCFYSECKKVNNFVKKLSNKDTTLLITGQSGSGKSRLAKLIHDNSNRKDHKFVEVHCTTLPNQLLESELFGHSKGSFTGATQNKKGKVEEADGGTLFLDEIGELSMQGQAKLLRLIQDKVICSIGSNTDKKVNIRIILATNKNLEQMVAQKKFREDLYYRINMFECQLPSLAGNHKRIQELINYFTQQNSQGESFVISNELNNILLNHNWGGNVRELKNVIDRLCFLCDSCELKIKDLPSYVTKNNSSISAEVDLLAPLISTKKKLTLKELEKKYILATLKSEPNLDKAAQSLGITKVTLWRKRKEYSAFLQ